MPFARAYSISTITATATQYIRIHNHVQDSRQHPSHAYTHNLYLTPTPTSIFSSITGVVAIGYMEANGLLEDAQQYNINSSE